MIDMSDALWVHPSQLHTMSPAHRNGWPMRLSAVSSRTLRTLCARMTSCICQYCL